MSEQPVQPSAGNSDEEGGTLPASAGISTTGRTNYELGESAGSDYGDPGGIGTGVDQELAGDGQREDDLDGEQ